MQETPAHKCTQCGQTHDHLPDLGFATPFYYNTLSEQEQSAMAEISDDFCVIRHPDQTDYFIRAVLTVPVSDTCGELGYGLWVSISERSFEEYWSEFKDNLAGKRYFGMICNEVADYEQSTLGLHVDVVTRAEGLRPELLPHESTHPLVADWENGISMAEAQTRIARVLA